MPITKFSIQETFACAPKEAIDYVIALPRLQELNPLLVSADLIDQGEGPEGPWHTYAIHERPHAGPLRYSVRFKAQMIRPSADRMVVNVFDIPLGATMRTTTRATQVGQHSLIEEECQIFAAWGLGRYMARQARASHSATFARVRDIMAAR